MIDKENQPLYTLARPYRPIVLAQLSYDRPSTAVWDKYIIHLDYLFCYFFTSESFGKF